MTIQCVEGTVYDGDGIVIENEEKAFTIRAGVSNVTIKNYKFRNCRYAVLGVKNKEDPTVESVNIKVENCEMYNDPGTDPFVDREGQNDGTSGTDTGAGVLVYGNGVFHNTVVKLNVCSGLARICLTGEEARAWMICGNRSDGAEDTSIYVKGHNSTIKWNYVVNSGKCGIKVRHNKDKTVAVGGHVISHNYVENFSMIKPDGGGCYNIAVSAIVEYNIGKLVEWPAGKCPSSSANCFFYSGDNIVSRNNTATVLDAPKYTAFKVDRKVNQIDAKDDVTISVENA
jgi:hypothetical protein